MPICEALIPLITAAASAGLQAAGNAQAKNAMNTDVTQELARQKEYSNRADTLYQQSLNQGTPAVAQAQTQTGAGQRGAAYSADQAVPLTPTVAPGLAGSPTTQTRDSAQYARSNQARAANAGYENFLLEQAIKNQRAGQDIGFQGNFARGSEALLPLRLHDAQYAGQGLQNAGSIVGLLGSMYGGYNALNSASVPHIPPTSPANLYPTPVGGLDPNKAMQYNAWYP